MTLSTGLLTIVIGVVSAAAVTRGSAGYMRQILDLPQWQLAAHASPEGLVYAALLRHSPR
jgi:hypothetical protein